MHSGPRPSSRPLQDLDLGGCFLASFALAFAMIRQAKITISEPRKAAMRSSNVTFNSPSPKLILNSLKNAPPITAPSIPTRRFAQRPNPSFFIVTTRPASVPAKPPTMIHTMIWPIFMTWILPPEDSRDLHGHFHPIKCIRRTLPRTGEGRSFFVFAGHGDRDMLETGEFVVSRVETSPTRSGDVNLRPGMSGPVLAFAHHNIAGDKSRPKTQMPGGLHHEHRIVAAGSGSQRDCLTRKLHARFFAPGVFERFV